MVLMLAFAWPYVQYGGTPQASALLYGIKPVIIAVIVQAIDGLLRTAIKTWRLGVAVVLAVALYFAGLNPLVPLFGLAVAVMLIENRGRLFRQPMARGPAQAGLLLPLVFAQAAPAALASFSLAVLFLTS
jgi:chromate transporter